MYRHAHKLLTDAKIKVERPFTRLVHVLSAPLGYIFRPYIVYRSRGDHRDGGNRPVKRGWEKIMVVKKK